MFACFVFVFRPVAVSGTTKGQEHAVAPGCAALRWTENVSGRCCGTGSRSIMGRFRGRPESHSATWFLVIIGRQWFQQERFCAGGAARVDLPSPARIFFLLVLFGTTSAGLDGTRCGFSPRQHDKYSWSAYINRFSTSHTFVKDGCCFCLRWAQIIVPFASLVICQKDGSLDFTQTWSDSFWQFAVSSAPPQSTDQNKPDTKQVVFLATHNLPRWC